MSYVKDIIHAAAQANGWEVRADDAHSGETYLLSGKRIRLYWAASGHVLMASYCDDGAEVGPIDFVLRGSAGEHPTAVAERVLSALAGRTPLAEHCSNDPAIGYNLTPRLLLPAEGIPTLPMRWYARPEGDSHKLRVAPRLACWEKADHPDQIRMRAYLDDTRALLGASRIDGPWALRLDVGLPTGRDLLDMGDLDNYAYPLAKHLMNPGLVSVWCTKQHSEQSFVRIEAAREVLRPSSDVLVAITNASASTVDYKKQIHAAVAGASVLPAGPVRLELAFVVGPGRNWLNLWKQTIDSLDPILGRTRPNRAWHPLDGRIIELGMHLTVHPGFLAPGTAYDVVVGITATPA